MTTEYGTIVATVYASTDYSKFKTLEGNRNLQRAHLNNLTESMRKKQLVSAAIVNENFEIIDGQNRFEAARLLKKPFYYYVQKNYGLEEVQILNTNNKNWSSDDFVESFIKQGKEDYALFKEFKEKYGFGQHETVAILQGKDYRDGRNGTSGFKSGEFKVKNWNKAVQLADKILKVGQYYEGYKRSFFIFAMLKVFKLPNYDHDVFLQKLRYQSSKLKDSTDINQYLEMIEDIYNHRNADKINTRTIS